MIERVRVAVGRQVKGDEGRTRTQTETGSENKKKKKRNEKREPNEGKTNACRIERERAERTPTERER